MKYLIKPELWPAFAILVLGVVIPSAFLTLAPENPLFDRDLYYWYAIFLTLGSTLAAVKLTFSRLISINPNINEQLIFESEESLARQQTLLGAHCRTAELAIMGVALFGLAAGTPPEDLASTLLFSSLHLGIVLFALGGFVMLVTHLNMRKL